MMRGRIFVAACLAAVFAGAPVLAADTPPSWRHKPTPNDLLAVWPRVAMEKNINGKAVIECKITVQGALYDCTPLSESPAGMGFGLAAVAISAQFTMNPPTHNGQPVGGETVRIPINFEGLGVAALGTHVVSGGPHSVDTDPSNKVVSNVPWLEAPTVAQVLAAYPAKARAAKVGGHAVLDCHFNGDGRLTHCTTLSEVPDHDGFADAAKALVGRFLGPRTDSAGVSLREVNTQVAFTFAAESLSGDTPVIGKPHWARLPEASDVAAGFPAAATAAHVSTGHVTLACTVGFGGRLADCSVVRQDPPGLGFDKAALALSSDFLVSVWTSEGLPTVGGQVRVPLRYEMPDDPPAAADAAGPPKP
jgi:TonB family protein